MEVDRVPRPVVPLLARAVRRLVEERQREGMLALDGLGDREVERVVLPGVAWLVASRDEAPRAPARYILETDPKFLKKVILGDEVVFADLPARAVAR